jgi:hypothetical protein
LREKKLDRNGKAVNVADDWMTRRGKAHFSSAACDEWNSGQSIDLFTAEPPLLSLAALYLIE